MIHTHFWCSPEELKVEAHTTFPSTILPLASQRRQKEGEEEGNQLSHGKLFASYEVVGNCQEDQIPQLTAHFERRAALLK